MLLHPTGATGCRVLLMSLPLIWFCLSFGVSKAHEDPLPSPTHEYPQGEEQQFYEQQSPYDFEGEQIQVTDGEMCELTGYFLLPHPCQCHLFYTWYQGVFTPNVCEPGLLFDKRSLTCLPPMMAACADGFGKWNWIEASGGFLVVIRPLLL